MSGSMLWAEGQTFVAPVVSQSNGTDEWVIFGDRGENVTVTCQAPQNESCGLRLKLEWGSDAAKDLDLFLYDSRDRLVASSETNQISEQIETNLAWGVYTVTVKNKSRNFSAAQDQLQMNLSGAYSTLSHSLIPSIPSRQTNQIDRPSVIETLPRPAIIEQAASCLTPLPADQLYDDARRLLVRGKVELVSLNGRMAIAVRGPLSNYFDVSNLDDDQKLFITPEGLRILGPEDWVNGLSQDVLEIQSAHVPFCPSEDTDWVK